MENPLKSHRNPADSPSVSASPNARWSGPSPAQPPAFWTAHGGADLRLGSRNNSKHVLVGGAITILKNMKVNGKDYPIYHGKNDWNHQPDVCSYLFSGTWIGGTWFQHGDMVIFLAWISKAGVCQVILQQSWLLWDTMSHVWPPPSLQQKQKHQSPKKWKLANIT